MVEEVLSIVGNSGKSAALSPQKAILDSKNVVLSKKTKTHNLSESVRGKKNKTN